MDASKSRTIQISTLVVGEEGVSYNVSTLDLGIATREQKIDHLQGFVATIVHQNE